MSRIATVVYMHSLFWSCGSYHLFDGHALRNNNVILKIKVWFTIPLFSKTWKKNTKECNGSWRSTPYYQASIFGRRLFKFLVVEKWSWYFKMKALQKIQNKTNGFQIAAREHHHHETKIICTCTQHPRGRPARRWSNYCCTLLIELVPIRWITPYINFLLPLHQLPGLAEWIERRLWACRVVGSHPSGVEHFSCWKIWRHRKRCMFQYPSIGTLSDDESINLNMRAHWRPSTIVCK